VLSQCLTADRKCAVCTACKDVGSYVLPESMCYGKSIEKEQACNQCKRKESCSPEASTGSDDFSVLFACYSGNISVDTSMCVKKAQYNDALSFSCKIGEYQDAFSQSALQYTFDGEVYLNRPNTYLADVSVAESSVKIYKTQDVATPLCVAVNSTTGGSAAPVIHILPSSANVYPVTFRVLMDGRQVALEEQPDDRFSSVKRSAK
jgi:hypothetical protein